jgi:hypothetical protein
LQSKQSNACFQVIIEAYDLLLEKLEIRFIVTEDHVTAGLLDPIQKDLEIFEPFLAGQTRERFLKNKLRQERLVILPEETGDKKVRHIVVAVYLEYFPQYLLAVAKTIGSIQGFVVLQGSRD